jgi:glucoamylase
MAAMASPGGMLPEQVWDAEPIPARHLFPGEASGSAMPLAWAHAEFVKLLVSRQLGHVFDQLRSVRQRYQGRRALAEYAFWFPHAAIATMPAGARLAIALPEPSIVHWGRNGWADLENTATLDSGLGFHVAALPTPELSARTAIDFTWRSQETDRWHGRDYRIDIVPG